MVIYLWYVYLINWIYLMLCLYLTWYFFVIVVFFLQNFMSFNNRSDLDCYRKMFFEIRSFFFYIVIEYREVFSLDFVFGNEVSVFFWYFKMVWVLFSIVSVGLVLVILVFFIFFWLLFDILSIGMMNFQFYGINLVIIGIEVVFSVVFCRFYYFVYVLFYGIIYFIFSVIFYGVGNIEFIYLGVLDWRKLGQIILFCLILGFIGMFIFQLFFFFVYKIRMFIYKKLVNDIILEGNDDEQRNKFF